MYVIFSIRTCRRCNKPMVCLLQAFPFDAALRFRMKFVIAYNITIRFHLIAPYESDGKRWLTMEWIDQYSGEQYRITTTGYHGSRQTARVKTYGAIAITC